MITLHEKLLIDSNQGKNLKNDMSMSLKVRILEQHKKLKQFCP